MAYNTTAALDKLNCTDYVDFGKCQDRFGGFSWSKNDSNYLHIKLKVFKREDKNAEFRLRQNLLMGEADFYQFIRQRKQLVEQLQCVAHSLLFVGMTVAPLFSLDTCIDQIQSVWVNFVCTKRLFNLLAEAIINVHNVGLCARCAIFLFKNKQFPFSCRLDKEFTFLK